MKTWSCIALISILLLAAFLRFYRLPEMVNFDFDQEYAANFAFSVLKIYPIQLIGQGLSVQGLFMGPLYFYYLVPFFALTNLYPIGGYIGSVILGLITVTVYYFIGKRLFGTSAGLTAAFFRSILFSNINADWAMVPTYSSELLVLITWLLFFYYWQGNAKILPILTLCFGFYTSFHPILFPLCIVFLIIVLIRRKFPTIKTTILSILSFLIPLTPLIIFEYFHNFLEVKRLLEIITNHTQQSSDLSHSLPYLLNLVISGPRGILGLESIPLVNFIILFYAVAGYAIYKKIKINRDWFHFVTLLVTFVIFIIYYIFFPTHVPEYYLNTIPIIFTLYFAAGLGLLIHKNYLRILPIFILLLITFTNFQKLTEKWNNPSLVTLAHKDQIVQEIVYREKNSRDFYVSYINEPGWNFGFNYLFKYYGRIPQTEKAKPPIYTVVIPKYLSIDSINISSGNIGLILPDK